MNEIEKYYNKFNEDKRLKSRHGQVEFAVAFKYILDAIADRKNLDILDVGAGTGAYSIPLANLGHNVTAVELVKKNLSVLKGKTDKVNAVLGNALNLKFQDNSFDIVLLFGPMYHLLSHEEKLNALNEAKRVTKPGGQILIMYLMNEYAVITYAFKEDNIKDCLKNGKLDKDFNCITTKEDLYSYVRIEEINRLKDEVGLNRIKLIGVDGATDYIRPILNKMDEEDFNTFIEYQLSICERQELIGASSHVLDILRVDK